MAERIAVAEAPGCSTPGAPSDGLAVAERSIAHAEAHAAIGLTPRGRARLEDIIAGLVTQLLVWEADPAGGPPDPWTCVRRRWHRHAKLRWWGDVPPAVRRMLTGVERYGRDSVIQLALTATAPTPALRSLWRAALLDLDPGANPAAAEYLARRRTSRRRSAPASQSTGGAAVRPTGAR